MTQLNHLKWWQKAVFYQIYPRSFADGGIPDGIGDFKGMIAKLDYLKDLGIDALWLSPHFPSPNVDCGYDVADYTGVAPEYGSLEDFKEFLAGAHQRGLRVILDMVFNHTSDRHAWFIESRSSRDNPKRDWFIWRDPKPDGSPPNNWNSTFGGSAWKFDEKTGQYYYHFFFKEQPDLNWRNPEVKKAMFEAVRFWLDLGVDGYRLDAIGTIFERLDMPDHPVPFTLPELYLKGQSAQTEEEHAENRKLWEDMFQYQVAQPGMHELMKDLRKVLDEYVDTDTIPGDRMLVGEDDDIRYHGNGEDELHLVFNFPLTRTERLTPAWVRSNQKERLTGLAAISPESWPCNTLGNHDSPRVASRFGDGQHDSALARLHLALILTLRGTPFLYNGEEIGMTDFLLTDINQIRDSLGIFIYHVAKDIFNAPSETAVQLATSNSRDRGRTPMQWANTANGGFSPVGITTWLPVNPNYAQGINVADQQADLNSMLNFYRKMLSFRKQIPALIAGDYVPLHETSEDYLAFLRQCNEQTCLVVLNFSDKVQKLAFDKLSQIAKILFTSSPSGNNKTDIAQLEIQPFEIFIAELT